MPNLFFVQTSLAEQVRLCVKSVVRELVLQLRNDGLLLDGARCPCMNGKKYVKLKNVSSSFYLGFTSL